MNPQNPQGEPGQRWAPGQNPFYTEPLNEAQPQQPSLPTQHVEVYNSPSIPTVPYGDQPAPLIQSPQTTVPGGPVTPVADPKDAKKGGPSPLVMVAVGGIVLVLILAVVAVLMSGAGTKSATQKASSDPTVSESMQPAQALDLQQAGNAIGQDLSGIDDEADFPANSLDTKSLNNL